MPFHVPFFMVLLYIMRFIELRGLYLKINVIFVLKLHAMKIHTRYETQWLDLYKSGHFWSKKSLINCVSFSSTVAELLVSLVQHRIKNVLSFHRYYHNLKVCCNI